MEEHLVAHQRCWPNVSTDAFDSLALAREVFVDVPTPVDQPFEQLVHSTRDVHVPVRRRAPSGAIREKTTSQLVQLSGF